MTQKEQTSKGWHIGLWVIQAGLAGLFGMAGFTKATAPIESMAADMAWVSAVDPMMVRGIGIAELLGAIGLVLPALLRTQPRLTTYAAVGLVLVMVCALVYHLMNGEANLTPVNIILGGLAALVAWGRTAKAPIEAK